jgi:hypothetical protein
MVFALCSIMVGNSTIITIAKKTFTLNPADSQACFMSVTSDMQRIETRRFHFVGRMDILINI